MFISASVRFTLIQIMLTIYRSFAAAKPTQPEVYEMSRSHLERVGVPYMQTYIIAS